MRSLQVETVPPGEPLPVVPGPELATRQATVAGPPAMLNAVTETAPASRSP